MSKKLSTWMALSNLFFVCLTVYGQTPRDSLVDLRDGQRYGTVQIGEQVWMAQNLNFATTPRSCYDHDPENCAKYGALYTWEQAMAACPEGWHLPAKEEWEQMAEFLGVNEAGQKLKASADEPLPWDGTNESGFSALSAGAGNGEGFQRKGDWALFWSATEHGELRAWFAQLDGFWYPEPPKYRNLYVGNYYLKTNEFSVRCMKDQIE